MSTVKENAQTNADIKSLTGRNQYVWIVFQSVGQHQGYTPVGVFLSERECLKWLQIRHDKKNHIYKKVKVQ